MKIIKCDPGEGVGRELGGLTGMPWAQAGKGRPGSWKGSQLSCLILGVPEVRSKQPPLCEHLEMEAGPQGSLNLHGQHQRGTGSAGSSSDLLCVCSAESCLSRYS